MGCTASHNRASANQSAAAAKYSQPNSPRSVDAENDVTDLDASTASDGSPQTYAQIGDFKQDYSTPMPKPKKNADTEDDAVVGNMSYKEYAATLRQKKATPSKARSIVVSSTPQLPGTLRSNRDLDSSF